MVVMKLLYNYKLAKRNNWIG